MAKWGPLKPDSFAPGEIGYVTSSELQAISSSVHHVEPSDNRLYLETIARGWKPLKAK